MPDKDEIDAFMQPCSQCEANGTHCMAVYCLALRSNSTPQCARAGQFLARIEDKLQILRNMGYKRILDVCDKIRQNNTGLFPVVHAWNLCALSGMMCSENICVTDPSTSVHVPVLINPIYKNFVHSFWLCHMVREFEVKGEPDGADITSDTALSQYCYAVIYVHKVLDTSIHKLGIIQ